MAKKCFIVVIHTFDANGTGTENVEVVRNLKDRHITDANIIIDVMGMRYEKNRLANEPGVTQEMMTNNMVHYIEKYKSQITEILQKSS